MNKIYKVVWNKARNCYVVGSEFISSHSAGKTSTIGSKSLKTLLAVFAVCGVMGTAWAEPSGNPTEFHHYVAFSAGAVVDGQRGTDNYESYLILTDSADQSKEYKYYKKTYTDSNGNTKEYWVRDGYELILTNGAYTSISSGDIRADVAWTGKIHDRDGQEKDQKDHPTDVLETVNSMVYQHDTVTNAGERLNTIQAGTYVGIDNEGGNKVPGNFDYIIHDPTRTDVTESKDGWVNLKDSTAPKGFVTTTSLGNNLIWNNTTQQYTYTNTKGQTTAVDISNLYVIGGQLGVFTTGTGEIYKGTVYGRYNEILMTAKDEQGEYYSYWAAKVTDPSATMKDFRVTKYIDDINALVGNDTMLKNNDIQKVSMTANKDSHIATISLLRNLNSKPVDGTITIKGEGGTGGKDTSVTITNTALQRDKDGKIRDKDNNWIDEEGNQLDENGHIISTAQKSDPVYETTQQKFNTGSVVKANSTDTTDEEKEDLESITINGYKYRIPNSSANDWTPMVGTTEVTPQGTDKKHITFKGDHNIDVTVGTGDQAGTITIDGSKLADMSLSNVTKINGTGKTEITNIAKDAVKVSAGNQGITVSQPKQSDEQNDYKVSVKADITKGIQVTNGGVGVNAGTGLSFNTDGKLQVNLEDGEQNLAVDETGLSLNKELKGITSITGAGDGKISFADGNVTVNSNTFNKDGRIQNVANGTEKTDAVNYGQLQAVSANASKHTMLVNGQNTTVKKVDTTDGHLEYRVDVDLSGYAKTDGVAVVYKDNKKSLHSTNFSFVGDGSIVLGKAANAVNDSIAIGDRASVVKNSGVALGNDSYAGYKGTSLGNSAKSGREGATVVGDYTNSAGVYSTVLGTDSVINSDETYLTITVLGTKVSKNVQGAAATIIGAKNKVDNRSGKAYSGVANNVMGSANTIKASNGVTIQGSGNTVTNAYKDMNLSEKDMLGIKLDDYSALAKKDSGAVAVIGGANTISDQTSSTVIGFGNTVAGQNATGVFTAGSHNTLTNVSNSLIMGDNNALKDRKNVISLGNKNNVAADNAVAIGNGATVKEDGGVALGVDSVADRVAAKPGATVPFAPKEIQENEKSTWLATKGAVSVGDVVKNVTRQITGVAAGSEDTDAVNVAQLKQVNSKAETAQAEAAKGWNVSTNGGEETKVAPGETVDFAGDSNIGVSNNGKNVKVELKKDLTGLTSVTTKNAYVTNVDASKDDSVTNVEYVKNQIADAALSAGDGISITDKKINVKLKDGEENLNVDADGLSLNKNLKGITSITGAGNGKITFAEGNVTVNKVTFNSNGRIQNVAQGTADMDAVNVRQLKQAVSDGNTDTHIKAGEYSVGADNKVSMDVVDKNGDPTGEKVTITDVAKASDVGNVSNIADDIKNKDGKTTTVVDAVNNLNDKVGDLRYSTVTKGDPINDRDSTTTAIGKLNQNLKEVKTTAGQHSSVSTEDSNLNVDHTGKNDAGGTDYKLSLNKNLNLDSVTTGHTKMNTNGVTVGDKVSLTKDGLTTGDTKVTNEGLSIGGKTYVTKDGLNANDTKITNVADGKVEKGSKDAVNGGQLYDTNQAVINNANNISNIGNALSNLDNRVNKVGAGAAALAALHPLDFDPDAKWDFAAGYGNYRGTNAAAVGAYYRPNEDTMFSVGGTFGNGENMVNAGVSFKLGSGSSHVSTSRVAMAKEIKELRGELEAMKSAMLDANAGKKIDTSKLQLFPDVPQNHWAYEYVTQLAGNGMIEGYPDGNFAGDRPMTRYEFAAILYRAMTKGAVLSDKILNEFSHELEYFTVDTVAKDKAGNPTIQRVRTVKANTNK